LNGPVRLSDARTAAIRISGKQIMREKKNSNVFGKNSPAGRFVQTDRGNDPMTVAVMTLWLYAPWIHSLKEKRMEVKSLLAKLQNKFNISAIESEEQDVHQTIVLTVAALAANPAQADSILDHILAFVESNTDAEITEADREFR